MRRRQAAGGYVEVNTPQVVDRKLWEASGHWEKYQEHMFIVEVDEDHAREKAVNALKPMNCPCHVQVYNQGLKSYRDLPLRMAEFGSATATSPRARCTASCGCAASPGRRAHLLHRGPDRGRDRALHRTSWRGDLCDLGLCRSSTGQVLGPARETRGQRRVWDKAEAALEKATVAAGCDFDAQPRRGGFLRAQARIRADGRHRPRLAVRHAAGGFRPARAAGCDLCRARTAPSTAR